MRLSKSSLQPPSHLLLDLDTDFLSDVEAARALKRRLKPPGGGGGASGRTQLGSPLDVCTLPGMLELPTSFGSLYLGEVCEAHCPHPKTPFSFGAHPLGRSTRERCP